MSLMTRRMTATEVKVGIFGLLVGVAQVRRSRAPPRPEDNTQTIQTVERISDVGPGFVLVTAGCSLAVGVAGGLVERKRPFALLRLSGMRLRELHRIVLAEAGGPLLVVSACSAVVGIAVAAIVLGVVGTQQWRPPSVGCWAALVGGLTYALAIVATTLPLLVGSPRWSLLASNDS